MAIIDAELVEHHPDRSAARGMIPVSEASGLARADELAQLGDCVRGFVIASEATATVRAYRRVHTRVLSPG
jgi:hypothetical protein